MNLTSLDFRSTHAFTSFFLDYIEQKPSLQKFYNRFPKIQNFQGQLQDKASFTRGNREILVTALTAQYGSLKTTDAVQANFSALSHEKTFTITTGHQLNVFTGPLYFIYKIVTVINVCRELQQQYPAYRFVPVYWMASEDHDYEEIKTFRLYGKKYTWNTQQTGAVGRFALDELRTLLNEVPGEISIFKEAYTKNQSLAAAVRHYVNALFGEHGLIVVDGDDRSLKSLFTPVIANDLFQHTAFQKTEATTKQLQQLGYHTQVKAREVNLFYLDKGIRSRIEKKGHTFSVVDSSISFTAEQINSCIKNEPEKFSPNVVLRPLYQEMILPNLAYVGGPAELVYWLQLRDVFEVFQVPLPILMPRNFAMVVDEATQKKFVKIGLELKDVFEEKNFLFNHWVAQNSQHDLSLGREFEKLKSLYQSVQNQAERVDSTLGKLVAAKHKRAHDDLERIEQKMLKAEKRRHEDKRKQIEAVKDALFPFGSLQERTDNFLSFYQSDPEFVGKLIQLLQPFDFQFNVLKYDEKGT
ncbi:MAG: bacillithiol biosynthesis cysteine-adding enzyme BshC [Cytophagales bacterium]